MVGASPMQGFFAMIGRSTKRASRKRPAHVVSVHAGKADVEKNDVGPECVGFRQCLSAVVDNVIFVADLLRHQAEGVGYIKVVVDYQDLISFLPNTFARGRAWASADRVLPSGRDRRSR
jgi:hypothetical protein